MPQLSPLNWTFLYLLFWFSVFSVSIMIWWSYNMYFKTQHLNSIQKENKWNW